MFRMMLRKIVEKMLRKISWDVTCSPKIFEEIIKILVMS